MSHRRLHSTLLLLCLLALACGRRPVVVMPGAEAPAEEAPPPAASGPEDALRLLPTAEVPLLLDDGDRASLRQAVVESRRWFARQDETRSFVAGPRTVSARRMIAGLDKLLGWLDADLSPEALAAEVVHAFDVLESVGGESGGMLITGYFEPVIAGSLVRTAAYQVPVHGPPSDLISVDLGDFSERFAGERILGRLQGRRLLPYFDRQALRERGHLSGREIAWARDAVDLFFLEVQGSGTLALPDGGELRIGYAGSNGRPYRSIGRLLIDEGALARKAVSMQSIRAYLAAHPEEMRRILDHNESYVFFRKLEGPPVGSLGRPVTPGRSIATDHRLFPSAALGFLLTDVPALAADGSTVAERPLARFVLNQDRGGAIRGAGRVDFFWGRGEDAAYRAGIMKQPGRLFFLIPKEPN